MALHHATGRVAPKGVVVNRAGERFCNEQVYGATLGHELVEHQGGKAWLILDGTLRRQATFNACLASCGPSKRCPRWP